jgi:hypothetical protein
MSDQTWGRKHLVRCGIDPDDLTEIQAAYEACRESHKEWLLGHGDMDYATFGTLVEAIKSACGWLDIPLDWPPAYLVVLPPEGLRDTLTRTPGYTPMPEFTGLLDTLNGYYGGPLSPMLRAPEHAGRAPEPGDRLPRRRNPRIGCEVYDSGTWIHGNPHDCPKSARGLR